MVDPGVEDWAERIREFAREADTAELRRRRVRIEDKGAIVAFHWRGAPDEEAARAAVDAIAAQAEARRAADPLGPQGARGPAAGADRQGRGDRVVPGRHRVDVALYVGDDATDLDAFHALVALAEEGRISRAIRVGVRSEEGPPEITAEADIVVDGTEGVAELLAALAAD